MLVSIIIPLYNAMDYIDNIVSNFNNQTYKKIEAIFVDDGSTDGTLDILKQRKIDINNVVYLQQKNSGPSIARNRGLDVAKGDYIVFWDDDDCVSESAIQDLVNSIKENDLGMMTICKRVIKQKKIIEKKFAIDVLEENNNFKKTFALMLNTNHIYAISLCNKIYKRDIIEKNNIRLCEGLSWSEDLAFNIQYYNYVNNLGFAKDSIYYYCIRKENESLTKRYNINNIFSLYETLDKMLICNKDRQIDGIEKCYMWCIKNAISNIANVFRNKNENFFGNARFIKKHFLSVLYKWCESAKAESVMEKIFLFCVKKKLENGIILISYMIHILRDYC